MTGRIFAIKPFEIHDGDGIRTTVFFKGCPLRCAWCHNPESFSVKPQLSFYTARCSRCGLCMQICPCGVHNVTPEEHLIDHSRCMTCEKCTEICFPNALSIIGMEMDISAVLKEVLRDKDIYESSGGGVTLSGGEPLLQANFCVELLKALKEHGVNTAVDTCGYVDWSVFERVIPFTDKFLYDLKAVDEQVHLRCTGVSNNIILENLRSLDKAGARFEIRIPYIPGFNTDEIPAMAKFISELSSVECVRLLPYHAYAKDKYTSLGLAFRTENIEPPKPDAISEAISFLRSAGIHAITSHQNL